MMDFAEIQRVLFELRNQKADVIQNDAHTPAAFFDDVIALIEALRDENTIAREIWSISNTLDAIARNPAFNVINEIIERDRQDRNRAKDDAMAVYKARLESSVAKSSTNGGA